MMTTLLPYLVSWAALATIVIVLAVYRRSISRQDDETLHVLDAEASLASQQAVVARKLEVVDRWGKILTVLVVLYGLALAGMYLYNTWQQSARIPE